MARRKGDAARAHAACIYRILLETRPAGLEFPQILAACELTRSQVRDGLAMLRDQIAEQDWPPLVYSRRDKWYFFTADPDELESYEVMWVRARLTQVRRFINGTLIPHTRLAPDDKRVRFINSQITAVESTLDLIA
ncbi:RacP protein [Streptomyces sp. NPDC001904]|uniref:RacP protein n=1 Tax=Streptomyces sp. NPDC001904 TaxID=3154531 RepID=UPI0033183771